MAGPHSGGGRGIWAVVPVKEFGASKSRLAPAFGPAQRRALARAMLADVLAALAGVAGLSGILVVSREREVDALARAVSAEVMGEEGEGLNDAVAAAARRLLARGAGAMLVVPGDIPAVSSAELARLIAAHGEGRAITLVAAADGGTNALLLSPPDALPAAYGAGSFAAHWAGARAAGLDPVALDLPGIGLDIDTPADVAAFLRLERPTRTRRFLLDRRAATPLA